MTLCLGNCCLTAYSFVHGQYSGFLFYSSMLKKLTLFLRWRKYNNNNNNKYIFWQTTREESLSFVERKVCNVIKSSNKFQEIILKENICRRINKFNINIFLTFSYIFYSFIFMFSYIFRNNKPSQINWC